MDDSIPLNFFILSIDLSEFGFWIAFAVLLVLLMISGLTSGSEVAFFSLTPEEKDEIEEEHTPLSEKILKLLKFPKDLLAIVLIINNFVNIAIVILSSLLLNHLFSHFSHVEINPIVLTLIEVVGITFVLLLIGEVIPKVYANRNSSKLVHLMAGPLLFVGKTPPFSWLKNLLVNGTDIILKYARKRELDVSTDDLETAIALTTEEEISEDEQRILEGIVNFGNTDVKQIMQSRVDTVAISEELNYKEILDVILESGYSRMPVYKDTFDNVTGILYIKDLLEHLDEADDYNWKEIIRKPFFVPENKKIDNLLKEFQDKKMHMAVVVDEYGGASGIVTLEDILEEIIGEITDEFDDDDVVYTKIDNETYLFEGKTALVDMYKVLDIDGKAFEEAKGEADSIGGFLIEQAGKIMKNNEFIVFENLKLLVESSDRKRIKMIKVIVLSQENEAK